MNPVKASTCDTYEVKHLTEEEVFTAAEVATVIKEIKSEKAAGEDEIRPEMLKALTAGGILWLTRLCQVALKFGKTPRDRQTGVTIPIFKKGDRKQSTNYKRISLLSLPWKVFAKCLERKCREIVEYKLKNEHWPVRFSSWLQHHRPELESEVNLREILGVWQRFFCMLGRS